MQSHRCAVPTCTIKIAGCLFLLASLTVRRPCHRTVCRCLRDLAVQATVGFDEKAAQTKSRSTVIRSCEICFGQPHVARCLQHFCGQVCAYDTSAPGHLKKPSHTAIMSKKAYVFRYVMLLGLRGNRGTEHTASLCQSASRVRAHHRF